jgi:aminoglycoside phosphotransferase (APT) family kinase protein
MIRNDRKELKSTFMDFSALIGHQDMLTPGTMEIGRLRAEPERFLRMLDAQEDLRTQRVIPLAAGMWNALYRLEPSGMVAKLSVGNNNFEVNFLREARALGLPVPRVYGAGALDDDRLPNVTYFLMLYVPNSVNAWSFVHEGMTEAETAQLGRDLGKTLATLHSVHKGYVTRLGTRVEAWQQCITDGFSPDWDNIEPNALFDAELLSKLEQALEQTNYLAFKDGSFVHGDLVLSNVLVDVESHQLSAIIDPAGYAGMPMFDLAYAAMPWDHGYSFSEAMVESYQQHSDKFDPVLFYTSTLVVTYRHERFHTDAVRKDIFKKILPKLGL